jgi:hypothetical protein
LVVADIKFKERREIEKKKQAEEEAKAIKDIAREHQVG